MLKSFQRPPKPHKQRQDKSVFAEGLSGIGPNTAGEYSFLQLSVKERGLHSIIGIEEFPHLQHVDLAHNQLVSLQPLSGLTLLLTLNASHNQLKTLFDFKGSSLIYADFSHNALTSMKHADAHRYLQILRLDHNMIAEVAHVEALPNLQLLSLNDNQLDAPSGFPASLQELNLAQNRISRLGEGLANLTLLRVLDLSYNKLSSLRGLETLESLMTLNLTGNAVRKVLSLNRIADIPLLSDLDLTENPVQEKDYYRLRVAYVLPQLRSLDKQPLTAEEKIRAENLYGLDIEDRKAIFNEYFPGQEFVDRRLVTSDMLDYESESDREDLNFIEQMHSGKSVGSKINSQASLDAGDSKRYVGEIIEKAEPVADEAENQS